MATTAEAAPAARRGLNGAQIFVIGVIAYFALQVVLRVLAGANLDLDEAEQVVMGQTFAFGYGPQLPLYTWLYIALKPLTGGGAFTLALIKFSLLAGMMLAVWRLAWRMGAGAALAIGAALSLALMPQIVWESQRTLAHTPLAFAAVAAAAAAFAEFTATRKTRDYLLFGLALAACALSKANGIVFPLALLIAGATVSEIRPALRDWRLAAALALTLVLVLPTAFWLQSNSTEAMARAYELQVGRASLLASVSAVIEALVGVAALAVVVLAAIRFIPAGKTEQPEDAATSSPLMRAMVRALVIAGVVVLVATVAAQAGAVKDRWLAPVLFLAAPTAVVWLGSRLTPRRLGVLMGVCIFMAFACTAGVLAYPYLGDLWEKPPYREAPFERLADLPEEGLMLSDSHWVAGNLRRQSPDLTAVTVEYQNALPPTPHDGPVLVVWEAVWGPEPLPPLAELVEKVTGEPLPGNLNRRCQFVDYPHGGAQLGVCAVECAAASDDPSHPARCAR